MPYFGNFGGMGNTNNQQRNAITQALLQVANPSPRTQVPGSMGGQGFGATRQPNVMAPLAPGAPAGPTTGSAPGMPGVPGQFNPNAAPGGPPAYTGIDPNGVQGPVTTAPSSLRQPGGWNPMAPPQSLPPMPGGVPAGPPPNVQQLLGNTPQMPIPGSQIQDPTSVY